MSDTKTASIKAGSQDKNKRPRTSKDDGSRQRNPKRRQESTTLKKAESAETVAFAEKSVNGENATTLDASKTAETQVMSEIVEKQSTLETAETVETQKSVETTVANTESDDTQDMFDMKEMYVGGGAEMSETVETEATFEKVKARECRILERPERQITAYKLTLKLQDVSLYAWCLTKFAIYWAAQSQSANHTHSRHTTRTEAASYLTTNTLPIDEQDIKDVKTLANTRVSSKQITSFLKDRIGEKAYF
ncbi:hypothetical protein PInf_022114 [Phytophthora infestans]|nr:hypothetical protein PInf_022114 [Phytophthora infestans]